MIERIIFTDYKVPLEQETENIIEHIISVELKQIEAKKFEIYHFNGKCNHRAGVKNQRFLLMLNATNNNESEVKLLHEPLTVYGYETNTRKLLPPYDSQNNILLYNPDNNEPIAEYMCINEHNKEPVWQLNILIDIFNEDIKPNEFIIFRMLIRHFYEQIILPIAQENSWKYSNNKEELIDKAKEKIKNQKEQNISRINDEITGVENLIKNLREDLKKNISILQESMKRLEQEKESIEDITNKVIEELNNIITLSDIKDLLIENNNEFKIITEPLHIIDSKGNKYYGGHYEIIIKPNSTYIKITSDNQRTSHWSRFDHHPHIGQDGLPCFGNLEPTIAELTAQSELYALVTVILNFIKSANLEDVAGRFIKNWDMIDENGYVIKEGKNSPDESVPDDSIFDESVLCDECQEYVDDELSTVFEKGIFYLDEDDEICDTDVEGEMEVCTVCQVENFSFYDEIRERVREIEKRR